MAERELLVRILGDDRDLQRALGNTDKRLASIDSRTAAFGKNLSRAFAAAGITLGAAAIFDVLGDAVDSASALNEEVAKSQQIFGDSASAIESWSKTTAGSIGVAQVEALKATGTFGNLFATVGLGQQQAAEMSQSLVQLAADLASFNNADPSDVLQAIRSGLIGEAEPLRRFGVLLSETRVQQEALNATGKENVKELTNQEKALARYNIILQDTALAQGDFARTSDGLANQSRILRAQLSDLSAELGTKLLPSLVAVVGGANDLIDAFTQAGDTLNTDLLGATIQDVDVSAIVDMRDRLAEVKGEGDDVVAILDEIIDRLRDVQGIVVGGPDSIGGARGFGAIQASNLRVDAEKELDAAKKAKNDLERVRAEFASFGKGLGLKLDKAELTEGLDDNLAVLRELERAILRQIDREGKTFKLVDKLTQVRLDIMQVTQSEAEDAKRAGEEAFEATIDALNLELEMAEATSTFEDNQQALRALESAILKEISAEGETTDLLRQLFNVRQQQEEVAREIAEQTRTRRKERQFTELGLTEEGDRPTPGTGALRRRLGNLREQIKGTVLDTEKTRRELDAIAEVLSGKFGDVGKQVREAILGMFNDITGALDQGGKQGPLTQTSGLNTRKILANLGLSDEEINELRGRLSSINTAGRQLSGLGPSPGRDSRVRGGADIQGDFFVESHTTINLDGQQVAKVVTKQQQKAKRRNPRQKRGPNRNI